MRWQANRAFVTNVVLGVILVGLCSWLAVYAVSGNAPTPVSSPAQEQAEQLSEIRRAAQETTLAFLEVDHTRMDELTARVLDGATGSFEQQYADSVEALKEAATSQESFASAEVFEVGLSEVSTDFATAFVAAGSKVQNLSTDGEVEDRFWRIKLTLVKEDGRWLVSQLEFVG